VKQLFLLILEDHVCVGILGTTTNTPTATTTGNGISTPTPTQSGMVSNYNTFYHAESGDNCSGIVSANGITLDNFYAWNPAVGSTCATLGAGYYVCVNIVGGTTATKTTLTTSTTTAGNGIVTPTPTQPNMATNCDQFHKGKLILGISPLLAC
jgi:hypothetical protein